MGYINMLDILQRKIYSLNCYFIKRGKSMPGKVSVGFKMDKMLPNPSLLSCNGMKS